MSLRRPASLYSIAAFLGLTALLSLVFLLEAQQPGRQPRKVAFLVGVAKYDHDFDALDFPEQDVADLAKVLREGGFEVVVLVGSAGGKDRATRANIQARLQALLEGDGDETKKIRRGDLVLVALSGHGQQILDREAKREDAYFVPVDGKSDMATTQVSISHMVDDLLAPCGSRNLLLVDACRAIGGKNKSKGVEGQDIALKGETAVLFSCGRGENSFEGKEVKHGVFTYAVLKGLRGGAAKDGVVTWTGLVSFVQDEMASKEVKAMIPTGSDQTPIPTSGQLPRTVLLTENGRIKPAPLDSTAANGVSSEDVRKAQEAWAKYLGTKVEEDVDVGDGVKMTFVLIPPGRFRMGSPEGEADRSEEDEKLHTVTLTKPFYLAKYTVTQAQYKALTGDTPSNFKGDSLPVEKVSWDDSKRYAESLTNRRKDGYLYRLPTEAEWEYSCRGGRSSSKPFGIGDGTSLDSTQANFNGNFPYGGAAKGIYREKTTAVGSFKPNAFGLYDMQGNVYQWCSDWYKKEYPGEAEDPTGPPEGSFRVIRGGGWFRSARGCRSADRSDLGPSYRGSNLGFRLARVPSGR